MENAELHKPCNFVAIPLRKNRGVTAISTKSVTSMPIDQTTCPSVNGEVLRRQTAINDHNCGLAIRGLASPSVRIAAKQARSPASVRSRPKKTISASGSASAKFPKIDDGFLIGHHGSSLRI